MNHSKAASHLSTDHDPAGGCTDTILERRAAEKKAAEFSEAIRCVPEFNMRSPYIHDQAAAAYRRCKQQPAHRLELSVDKLPTSSSCHTTTRLEATSSRLDSSPHDSLVTTRRRSSCSFHELEEISLQDRADTNRRGADLSSRSDSGTSAPDVYQSHSLSEKLL